MSEDKITPAEWERRKAAAEAAREALRLPVGTRVRVAGYPRDTIATLSQVDDGGDPFVRFEPGTTRLEIIGTGWEDLEVVDEPVQPEAPKWLRPGMLVTGFRGFGDSDGREAMVMDEHPFEPGRVLIAKTGDDATDWADAADLKPYVPQFQPGDRVVLATTGDVGTVSDCDHDPARGVVAIRLDGHRLAKFMAAAHLLAKLDEPS